MPTENQGQESSGLVEKKISIAFGDADITDVRRYVDLVLSAWQRSSEAITRTVLLGFLLAGIFELLVYSTTVKSLTVGPISLTNTSFLQIIIPALIAYLVYDIHYLIQRWHVCARIYELAIKKSQPKLYDAGLIDPILPRTRGPWVRRPVFYLTPGDELEDKAGRIIWTVTFFLLPPAFEIQAYYELIHKFGFKDILLWASMLISVFFIVLWLASLIIRIRHPPDLLRETILNRDLQSAL